MSDKVKCREYLDKKVNFLLKGLLVDILKKKPDNVCDFIINWAETSGRKLESEIKTNISSPPDQPNDLNENFENDFNDVEKMKESMDQSESNPQPPQEDNQPDHETETS